MPVPPVMLRPACSPPASLMQPAAPLAALPDRMSQSAALAQWLDDMHAYQSLRLQARALQDFVRHACQ